MANRPTSLSLSPADISRVVRLRQLLTQEYGKVSFTFIVRKALWALEKSLAGRKAA